MSSQIENTKKLFDKKKWRTKKYSNKQKCKYIRLRNSTINKHKPDCASRVIQIINVKKKLKPRLNLIFLLIKGVNVVSYSFTKTTPYSREFSLLFHKYCFLDNFLSLYVRKICCYFYMYLFILKTWFKTNVF